MTVAFFTLMPTWKYNTHTTQVFCEKVSSPPQAKCPQLREKPGPSLKKQNKTKHFPAS